MAIEAAQSNGALQVTHQQRQPQSRRPCMCDRGSVTELLDPHLLSMASTNQKGCHNSYQAACYMQVPLAAQATSVLDFSKLPDGHQALPGHKAVAFSIEVVAEGSGSPVKPQTVPQQWRQVALLLAAEMLA